MRTYTIAIPRVPVSQNDEVWRERWQQWRYKQTWKEEVYYACKAQRIPALEQVALSITVYFPDKRHRDLDNYHPTTAKAIQDGLTFAGVIPTDDERYIPQLPTLAFRHDREHPRTEVTITEVERERPTQT